MIRKVLIANRGAIAVRIIRTLKIMDIIAVAVYSDEDRDSLHVSTADESYNLGSGPAKGTYLDQKKMIKIAKRSGAQAIHPGYGFLSENASFSELCEAEGIIFIGPTADQMRMFGLKHEARAIATRAEVPLLPGTGLLSSLNEAIIQANQIGYPIILKSTAGGGGIGMEICHSEEELRSSFDKVKSQGKNSFSDEGVFLEKFIERARHIEVQVFGDGQGEVIALAERDCSAQRRNQKVIEEAPAPNLSRDVQSKLHQTAVQLAAEVNYRNAGTVEFILDQKDQGFYFLEMNTRLQVEHGVTEYIFDIDLVRWMVLLGFGELPSLKDLKKTLHPKGHALQVRVYAESPAKNFQPSSGLLTSVVFPEIESGRIDTWVDSGMEVTPYYDPLLAKVIVYAADRDLAIREMIKALNETTLYGIETNLDYLNALLQELIFESGEIYTQFLRSYQYVSSTVEVIQPGTFTTIQDYPGRTGYWHVGVPPSGPFDNVSFQIGNALLGNSSEAAGLEITVRGPKLKFNISSQIVLTGADIHAALDGQEVPLWEVISIKPGQTIDLGAVKDSGMRSYCLIAGGIHCPDYLGSKSTFTLGQFGGHGGRILQIGDVLSISSPIHVEGRKFPVPHRPEISDKWELRVIYGPHGAPDFFTEQDIHTFFNDEYEVHFNSSRTGIRLIGPKPDWARTDGGEAGMHPSNIHDNAYAVGTVDFTGDMPVILGPDGPSLGGFVCPATVIMADLWKLGQLKPGDKIKFTPVSIEDAVKAYKFQKQGIEQRSEVFKILPAKAPENAIIKVIEKEEYGVRVCYRPSGDDFLLIEYGPIILDIELRFRVHALMLKMQEQAIEGVMELTPGIRSLQVHYDPLVISLGELLDRLEDLEASLKDLDTLSVPSRVVHLPISWNDEVCQQAIAKYMQSVRKDAPWCPDNIEFIRRINGLDSVEEVKRIVFEATYVVLGLGDVYLGAPVATPIDPRHRLVTTKYNPARTWTAENSVGIGGSYLCVYGMEGPGGYQFIGRTVQMWNKYQQTKDFSEPWLLRFFDQIRFYEVSSEELLQIRRDFPKGRFELQTENVNFSLAEYRDFLSEYSEEIGQFKQVRDKAFDEELQRWVESGQINFSTEEVYETDNFDEEIKENEFSLLSHVSGSILNYEVEEGQKVESGQKLVVIESMKMEISVLADDPGTVKRINLDEGNPVRAGQNIMIFEKEEGA